MEIREHVKREFPSANVMHLVKKVGTPAVTYRGEGKVQVFFKNWQFGRVATV